MWALRNVSRRWFVTETVSLGAGSRVWQRLNYRLSPVFLSLWGDETALVYHHKCHGKCSQGSWEICQGHHTPHRRRNWQRLSSHCYQPRRMRRLQFHQAPASLSEGKNCSDRVVSFCLDLRPLHRSSGVDCWQWIAE